MAFLTLKRVCGQRWIVTLCRFTQPAGAQRVPGIILSNRKQPELSGCALTWHPSATLENALWKIAKPRERPGISLTQVPHAHDAPWLWRRVITRVQPAPRWRDTAPPAGHWPDPGQHLGVARLWLTLSPSPAQHSSPYWGLQDRAHQGGRAPHHFIPRAPPAAHVVWSQLRALFKTTLVQSHLWNCRHQEFSPGQDSTDVQ